MTNRTGAEQTTIGQHVRNTVFATEVAALNVGTEGLTVVSDMHGTIAFEVFGGTITVADLETKWTAHQSGCTDGCKEWSL